MKKTILVCMLVMVMGLLTGCASIVTTSLHNSNVEARAQAVRLQANNGGAQVAVDLLALKGYFGAWQENTWGMLGATLLDVGTGWAGYEIYQHNSGGSSGSNNNSADNGGRSQQTTYNVSGGDNSSITINNTSPGGDNSQDSGNTTP